MFTSLLPIIDKFLRSVVVLTDLIGYQKRCRTLGLSGDKFSRPDHIFASLGPTRRSNTDQGPDLTWGQDDFLDDEMGNYQDKP